MADVIKISQYDDFVEEWCDKEDSNETETRLLWHLLGHLDRGEVLLRVSGTISNFDNDSSVFVGLIDKEEEDVIYFANITPALETAEHAYHIDKLGSEPTNLDQAGWIDERLGEHRAAFKNRGTVDMERVPKDEIEKIVRKRR